MSMFMCIKCGDLKDSDHGCEEAPCPPYSQPNRLLCIDCLNEEPPAQREFTAEQQAIIDACIAANEAEEDDEA